MKTTTHPLEETDAFAGALMKKIIGECVTKNGNQSAATIVGLYGDLGSGKTTFAQAAAKALGIKEGVTSPTFVIEKIYKIEQEKVTNKKTTPFTHLIHIDAYRLDASDELIRLGWREISANPANLILIEWPERVADIMPADHRRLKFTFINEKTREITEEITEEVTQK
jgi:tRNA threonylcarbamoyladenosine biosynthesis protein TsaE